MIFHSDSDIVIRIMRDSDVDAIVKAEAEQGVQVSPEEFRRKLNEQNKFKNFTLIAFYKGVIAGYVNVFPLSNNGPLGGKGYAEIANLKIFDKYKDLNLEDKVLSFVEKVGAEYSGIVYLCVGVHDGNNLNKYVQRNYVPHNSGACDSENELVIWLYKEVGVPCIHKLSMLNTPEYPFLRWWEDRKKTIYTCVNVKKCKEVRVHDDVILEDFNSKDYVVGTVISKHEYVSYEELLKNEGVEKILPFLKNNDIEKALQFFKDFQGTDFIEKFGCVAFEIKILDEKF